MIRMNNIFLFVVVSFTVFLVFTNTRAFIGDWHNYTYSDNSNDITSDSQYIWCATTGGAIRYNLLTDESRKYLNSDGLGDINLLSIEIDSAGSVFFGGSNGTLSKIESDFTIRTYDFQYTSDIKYNLWDLDADGDILWVATDIGIGKFLIHRNGGEFKDITARLGDIPLETPVRAVRVIGDYLWAGTEFGLAYIINRDSINIQFPQNWGNVSEGQNGLTDARIYSIASIADTVFAGTHTGVFMMDSDSLWQNIGPASQIIYSLEVFDNLLLVATNAGVYQRLDGTWQLLSVDSLLSYNARGITEDIHGNIWAAFVDGGFARYDNNYWTVVRIPGPTTNFISDVAVDSLENVWLTHAIPGFANLQSVSRFDGENWYNYGIDNSGLGSSGAFKVEYDNAHNLIWFGSWGDGLYSYDGDTTWINYDETNSPLGSVPDNLQYIPVTDLAMDQNGSIWILEIVAEVPPVTIASFNHGDSTWGVYYERPDQIADHFMRTLFVSGNDLFIGGTNIYHLNFGISSTDTTDDQDFETLVNTSGGEVNALALDDNGRLFIGSSSGLSYYAYRDTLVVSLPDGYRSAVNSIALDGLGNKWIGCDSGVVVMANQADINSANWIDKFKTSNSSLLNNTVRHIEIDKATGKVYIGTTGGLSIYESGYATPSLDLNDMRIYPNPVNIKEGDAEINFLRVPTGADIYIYTVAGELVRKLEYEGGKSWNLKNGNGEVVAAGIYIFHVHAGDKSGSGKFAVIR